MKMHGLWRSFGGWRLAFGGWRLAVGIWLLFTSVGAASIDANGSFVKAEAAYKAGEFQNALEEYNTILDAGLHSPELFYNLGNTYYQLGDPGRSVLNYRRAERFIPGDPDLTHNLKHLRKQTGATAPSVPLLIQWFRQLPHNTWMLLAVLAFWITALLLVLLLWRNASRATCLKITIIGALIFLLGMTGGHFTAPVNQLDEVVILEPDQPARFSPLADARVHFKVPAGTICTANNQQDGQLEIRWEGKTGWIPQTAAESVDIWTQKR